MHKYIPRLHIIQTLNSSKTSFDNVNIFVFPETQFIAVTAYQNENVKSGFFLIIFFILY
jgi:hypothetical protein